MSRLQHGQARARAHTKEYDCWVNMRDRCRNPRRRQYPDYGGRGIKVCERWAKFENFFADMGPLPGAGYTIERMDVNGDYEPGNCRWATRAEQARNMRPRNGNPSGVAGVYWAKWLRKWLASITVGGRRKYLGTFGTLEDAVAARRAAERLYWSVSEARSP